MSIRIEPYQPEHKAVWEAFVAASCNGTFFHTRRFLSYHAEGRFTDASLLFYKDTNLVAVLPAAAVDEEDGRWIVSHPGATNCGLVLSERYGMHDTGEIVDAFMEFARGQGYNGARFLRLTPTYLQRFASDDQEYWLYQRGWSLFRFELSTALILSSLTEATLLDSFDGKCRNAVRQGLRSGVTVALSDDFDQYWPILEETLQPRHNTHPTHTLEEIKRLRDIAPQEVRLLAAFREGRMIAGIVFITLHDQAMYTLYIAQRYSEQHLRPLHLLIYELMALSLREGRKVFHFGISTENHGSIVNEGLFFFKESFGGVSLRRESWQCTF